VESLIGHTKLPESSEGLTAVSVAGIKVSVAVGDGMTVLAGGTKIAVNVNDGGGGAEVGVEIDSGKVSPTVGSGVWIKPADIGSTGMSVGGTNVSLGAGNKVGSEFGVTVIGSLIGESEVGLVGVGTVVKDSGANVSVALAGGVK
jgi:hypothetical protein